MHKILIATIFASSIGVSTQAAAAFSPWRVSHTAGTEAPARVPPVGFAPWTANATSPADEAIDFDAPRFSFHGFGPWIKPGV